MTTLIDRIMSKVKALRIKMKLENGYILEEGIRQILEAELTAVKGVDELVEKYKPFIISFENIGNSLASGIVEEFISDLKSLKQTPVKDSQQKEVKKYKEKSVYDAFRVIPKYE